MTVRLEGSVKRFIGLSTDVKPFVGQVQDDGETLLTAQDLPAGSSFLESDTGAIARWDGADWRAPSAEDATVLILQELLLETKAVRTGLELQVLLAHEMNVDLRSQAIVAE
jgi:hypothetical protein